MFSSSNNANPFPHLIPSSLHLSPSSFIGHNTHEIFLHHNNYYHDLLMGHSLPTIDGNFSSLEAPNKVATINQAISGLNGGHYDPLSLIPKKKPVKKDRHSKIITAQGQRDRRVRLSIGIARKFFDLQDMLGFDKASKTLDWLLTKSKTSINELVQMKHNPNSGGGGGFSSACDCDVVVSKANPLISNEQAHRDLLQLLARESRAKARARARERTREKMSTRQVNESKRLLDLAPPMLIQSSSLKLESQTHITMSSIKIDSEINEALSHPQVTYSKKGDIMDESIVVKRKLKPTSVNEHQLDHSKQASSNMLQRWDTRASSGPVTNMTTPSSGFQIYGNPGWSTIAPANANMV